MYTDKDIPITLAGASDVGMVREENEDSFLVRQIRRRRRGPFGIRALLVVADGMGGHVGGREASRTVVSFLEQLFAPRHQEAQAHFGDDISSFIGGVIREADSRVHEIAQGGDKPPGTTFTGAFVVDNRAFIGHIGDSRAYQIRNDEIVALTRDHSYVAHLVSEGKLSPEEAKHFPQKNILMRSLGTEGGVETDEPREVNVMDGDVLVLCTDGLWDLVSDREIVSVVQDHRDLDKACTKLIRIAKARGGHDNITVALARFGSFKRGRAASLTRVLDIVSLGSPDRFRTMLVRGLLYGSVFILSAVLILIVLFVLNESSVLRVPLPFEALKKMLTK
jgi:protein phosphatase